MYSKKDFAVVGLRCAACAQGLEKHLSKLAGVRNLHVLLGDNLLSLELDEELSSPQDLKRASRELGFDLIIEDNEAERYRQIDATQEREYKTMLWHTVVAGVASILLMALMLLPMSHTLHWLMFVITIPAYAWAGASFHRNAWKQLRKGIFSMDTLVSLSTSISFFYSLLLLIAFSDKLGTTGWHLYFDASAMIIAFVLLGKLLEKRAGRSTGTALRELMSLQPSEALLLRNGEEQILPIAAIEPGDLIRVRAGEQIAIDGVVIDGHSEVRESMISGEPLPVDKEPGAAVYAGTINGRGLLTVKAVSVGANSVLGGIIRSVREAQASRAPIQRLVDKVAAVFVPIVIGIALLSYVVWQFSGHEQAQALGLLSAISVLVIACPCALGLATPTALVIGIGRAARSHILIRNAEALERMCQVDTVVLDKTGTLTEGKPELTAQKWWLAEPEKLQLEALLYAAEQKSTHPLAHALCAALEAPNDLPHLADVENLAGRGLEFVYQGKNYRIGSWRFVEEVAPNSPVDMPQRYDGEGEVFFARTDQLIARFAFSDKLQEHSAEAIAQLKELGLEPIMLTGDRAESAAMVAQQLSIDRYEGAMMPADKARYLEQLQAEGHKVAMVGDGINDSEALSRADLSIAMSHGSHIAIEVAMLTLMRADLRLLVEAYKLSKATRSSIRQNLFWAMIYNLLAIPIAAGVLFPINGFLLNPGIAAAAMAFSSISVLLNSLRLRTKPI